MKHSICEINPLLFDPDKSDVIYIHSTLPGDEAIVYDNSYPSARRAPPPRYDDAFISILSGRAHLSPIPFGQTPIWGWGGGWRDHREFVGQIEYGCVYKLWNPDLHITFGSEFQKAVQTMLACQRRGESSSLVCSLMNVSIMYSTCVDGIGSKIHPKV